MLKPAALQTCILLMASAASSQAAPPDSPGTIHIDGLPCNRACQSYMTWSRQAQSQQATAASSQAESSGNVQSSSRIKARQTATPQVPPANNVAPNRVARRASPKRIPMPPTKTTEPQLVNREEITPGISDKKVSSPVTKIASIPEEVAKPDQAATDDNPTTPTASPALERQTDGSSQRSTPPSVIPPSNADTAALAPSTDAIQLFAILLVGSDIKSVSDLANKIVAIDVSQSASIPDVKSAMAAAGAAEVQMSAGESLALIRVMDGEVPAAVVDVLSPAAAEAWNAGIKGFNILRVPLSAPGGIASRG